MTTKNPYRKNARFWIKKTKEIIKYFCADLPASKTSSLLEIDRNSINDRYNYLRNIIYEYSEQEKSEVLWWEIELDESYFWASRVRWKRWRWAWGKIKVFWLLKRNGKVYTEIVDDVSAKTLLKIIRWKVDYDSKVNTDWRKSYDWLVDLWYEKHYRVIHSKDEFARGNQHINWIESFRSYCKRRLAKFNWIKKEKFALHLKESEFRFNCRLQKENIYNKLLKLVRKYAQLV